MNKLIWKLSFITMMMIIIVTAEAQEAPLPEGASLPRGWRDFSLGMALEDLKTALGRDSAFIFRGDRDVSFLPRSEENIVESAGRDFISRAFFQLRDGKVFIMSFTLNTTLLDHYSLFQTLQAKYGSPARMSARESVWENAELRIALERPLVIKYIDRTVFDGLAAASETQRSEEMFLRQQFLDDF
jgi:hypothetical protein